MYQIYIDKYTHQIKVSKLSASFKGACARVTREVAEEYPGTIVPYNDFYSFCTERKPLVELARETKQQWIDTLLAEFDAVQAIKV